MRTPILILGLAASAAAAAAAAQVGQSDVVISARARLFPEATAGVAAIKSRTIGSGAEAARQYYLLLPGLREGAGVLVFDAAGKRVARIPASRTEDDSAADLAKVPPKDALVVYGHDFDVDAKGRVVIADRGANAVKIFSSAGALEHTIAVAAPTSVVALPTGELAVTSLKSQKLIAVYALRANPVSGAPEWRMVREFGDPAEVADTAASGELNRYLNLGLLAGDPAGGLYYAFSYLPEPTVRKYDMYGYAQYEAELATLDFQASAQASRRTIDRLSQSRFTIGQSAPPPLRATVSALAADPNTGELWVAVSGVLLRFGRDGERLGTYRTFTAEGARIEASAILVEPDRLILASDTLGVYEFARPDKPAPVPAHKP